MSRIAKETTPNPDKKVGIIDILNEDEVKVADQILAGLENLMAVSEMKDRATIVMLPKTPPEISNITQVIVIKILGKRIKVYMRQTESSVVDDYERFENLVNNVGTPEEPTETIPLPTDSTEYHFLSANYGVGLPTSFKTPVAKPSIGLMKSPTFWGVEQAEDFGHEYPRSKLLIQARDFLIQTSTGGVEVKILPIAT